MPNMPKRCETAITAASGCSGHFWLQCDMRPTEKQAEAAKYVRKFGLSDVHAVLNINPAGPAPSVRVAVWRATQVPST
eukprot:6196554-Pleurochrysis_carterae.AAC.5